MIVTFVTSLTIYGNFECCVYITLQFLAISTILAPKVFGDSENLSPSARHVILN